MLRLFLALLLATIGLQAVPSGDLSIERDHGSAFSASSIDSAFARQLDRTEVDTVAQPVLPPPDRDGMVPLRASAAIADRGGQFAPAPTLLALAVSSPPYLPRPPPHA